MIVEDDIYIGEDFFEIINDRALISTSFDIIKLETVFANVLISDRAQVKVRERHIKTLQSYHHGAGGYLINRKAAEELLILSAGAPDGVDNIIFNMRKIKHAALTPLSIGQLTPAVIVQHSMRPINANANSLDSYIGNRRGIRKGRSPMSFAKFRRELTRPLFELNFKLNSVAINFK
jgi:GR25 family glycosyltransferase involved in LPS biosynthesis